MTPYCLSILLALTVMEDASSARKIRCIRAMVNPDKSSVTKLLDTHIYIVLSSDIIYDPEVLNSHVTDALVGISSVLCYRYPSIATGCRYLLINYERKKKGGASGSGSTLF